jgi:hypothetical protein
VKVPSLVSLGHSFFHDLTQLCCFSQIHLKVGSQGLHFNSLVLYSGTGLELPLRKFDFYQVPVAHTCNLSYLRGREQEDHSSRPAGAKSETLTQKYPAQKRADKVAQVVERLPSKLETNSSNHCTAKKNFFDFSIHT